MADDAVGVGQDGVVAGQRGEDVRFDPDAADGFVEQDGPQDRRDGGDQGPAETVALEKHHLRLPYFPCPTIRRKISRVKVAEFRQKSTKGRKCDTRFIPGV